MPCRHARYASIKREKKAGQAGTRPLGDLEGGSAHGFKNLQLERRRQLPDSTNAIRGKDRTSMCNLVLVEYMLSCQGPADYLATLLSPSIAFRCDDACGGKWALLWAQNLPRLGTQPK